MSSRAGVPKTSVVVVGGLIGLAAGALGYSLIRGLVSGPTPTLKPGWAEMAVRGGEGLDEERQPEQPEPEQARSARKLQLAAAALSFSVLVDSGLEHYRGGFYNRLMYLAPAVSALAIVASAGGIAGFGGRSAATAVYAVSVVTGLTGSGFHVSNIAKRDGGWRWQNLFYGAPLAAPMGLVFAGLFGLTAESLASSGAGRKRGLGNRASQGLALLAAAGLAGTSAEAALLHFRGAFHDPYMFLPVILPPLAAVAVAAETVSPGPHTRRAALALLRLNRALGFAGIGFHAFGVQRNMGGWHNWSQNLLQGPPLPAPPSFTGMALAAEAALDLQRVGERNAERVHVLGGDK